MQETDDKSLSKIITLIRITSVITLLIHFYWYCHRVFIAIGLEHKQVNDFFIKLQKTEGLFNSPLITQVICLGLLLLAAFGSKGKKSDEVTWGKVGLKFGVGFILFFGFWWILKLHIPNIYKEVAYTLVVSVGYLFLMDAGTLASRILKNSLMKDVFNTENESFMQETRFLENPNKNIPTIHLKSQFYYKGKWHDGMINVVNPHRATNVLGTPGSGKSFAIINEYIRQLIEHGNALYVYDFKFPTLTDIVFNHFRLHPEGYTKNGGKMPKVYIINFDDPARSHRCNPLHPSFLKGITDAFESAHVIMMNLNRTWIKKQGDFFVESPIILLAAIIWFLKIYQNGKYCTFPHAIELLNKKYTDIFTILSTYSELENYMSPFMDAWEGGAQDQLQGQISSAKIPLARIISKELYWVLSGDDFTLDINNPDDPKILCLGNNPKRETIYAAALGLYNFRIVQIINEKDKQPCGLVVDELPTMYFGKIDRLIGTARSNKIAVCLGFQDYSQLTKDYGREEMEVITNTVGNVFAGQVLGSTAKGLSERFGKVLQQRQSMNINKQDTSTSFSTQMDSLIPAGKIANLRQGVFVGSVAEDFGVEMTQNIFHAKIMVDIEKIKAEEKKYIKLPVITELKDKDGNDILEQKIEDNYRQIKNDVIRIVEDEMERISNDPNLAHLIKEE
ncbi:MAG: conjugal transfer protein MobC [Bacteroidales bacterium]